MMPSTSQWVEILVAVLLCISGVLALIASWGLLRLRDFFQRMHPPALVATVASWCVALAAIIYFSTMYNRLDLGHWPVIIILSISVPVTSMLLARAALRRMRPQVPPYPEPARRSNGDCAQSK